MIEEETGKNCQKSVSAKSFEDDIKADACDGDE
jgi:hypothetical protein